MQDIASQRHPLLAHPDNSLGLMASGPRAEAERTAASSSDILRTPWPTTLGADGGEALTSGLPAGLFLDERTKCKACVSSYHGPAVGQVCKKGC